jgi:hypothetical protein
MIKSNLVMSFANDMTRHIDLASFVVWPMFTVLVILVALNATYRRVKRDEITRHSKVAKFWSEAQPFA